MSVESGEEEVEGNRGVGGWGGGEPNSSEEGGADEEKKMKKVNIVFCFHFSVNLF